ncbi:hypothetical protein [Halobacillus sp. BAB-2008]|uniref:hypothetical protein n=1 Tax=Halobacillus sp. BAB-2008 TaxID=1246484 RepID=UPI0002A4E739|nr:hypothetical protein [Halobacillus sp. BAB-2008]ELK48482.1 hypothetical protein D479_02652 [Halobacillus sp. BAB-2008]
MQRMIVFMVWTAFILYAVLAAPNGNAGYLESLIKMDDPDPSLLMVFSFLGIYAMIFAALLLEEDDSKVPAWPFVIASFFLGAFALLPYFLFASGRAEGRIRIPNRLIQLLHSKAFLLLLGTGTTALFLYGVSAGDFELYGKAFRTSQFVHIMTVDFIVLTLLSVYLIYWKERRHGSENMRHWIGMVPMIGALVYLFKKRV